MIEEKHIALDERRALSCAKKRIDGPGRMAAYYRAQIRVAKKEIARAEAGLAREGR
jgi:hypothetical protein